MVVLESLMLHFYVQLIFKASNVGLPYAFYVFFRYSCLILIEMY